jgi:hypothetical protein
MTKKASPKAQLIIAVFLLTVACVGLWSITVCISEGKIPYPKYRGTVPYIYVVDSPRSFWTISLLDLFFLVVVVFTAVSQLRHALRRLSIHRHSPRT